MKVHVFLNNDGSIHAYGNKKMAKEYYFKNDFKKDVIEVPDETIDKLNFHACQIILIDVQGEKLIMSREDARIISSVVASTSFKLKTTLASFKYNSERYLKFKSEEKYDDYYNAIKNLSRIENDRFIAERASKFLDTISRHFDYHFIIKNAFIRESQITSKEIMD